MAPGARCPPADGRVSQIPRVVIVGAGFAGLNAARALRRAHADVTIVDSNDYHTFKPLLYQVSTGYHAAEEVGAALRAIFRRQASVSVRVAKAARLAYSGVRWSCRMVLLLVSTT